MSKRIQLKNSDKEFRKIESSSCSQIHGDSSSRSAKSVQKSERDITTKIEIEFKGQNSMPSSRQFSNRFYGGTSSNFSCSPQYKTSEILNSNKIVKNSLSSSPANKILNKINKLLEGAVGKSILIKTPRKAIETPLRNKRIRMSPKFSVNQICSDGSKYPLFDNKLLQPIPTSKTPNKTQKKIKLRVKPKEFIYDHSEAFREEKIIIPLNKLIRIDQDVFNTANTNQPSITENFKKFKLNLK